MTPEPGHDAASRCPNCGSPHDSPYCPDCGQHREAERLLPLRGLVAETAREVVNLDSRVARTLRLILLRPGEATVHYLAGRRQAYVAPLRLYLVVSAISIFVLAASGLFSLELMLQDEGAGITEFIEALGGDPRDPLFQERFEAQLGTVLPILGVFTPILLAMGLKALYPRDYLHAHFIFALHAWSAVVLVMLPLLLLVRILPGAAVFIVAYVFVYLFLAQRRTYGDTRLALAVKYAGLVLVVLITTALVRSASFFLALLLAARG